MARKKRKPENYPEIEAIRQRIVNGRPDESIAILVPSHTREQVELSDLEQATWKNRAIRLFGKLYTGATAFNNLSGVYQPTRADTPLFDTPTLVQSLTAAENIMDENNLIELAEFCRGMGQATNQVSVGLIINNKFVNIIIPHEE